MTPIAPGYRSGCVVCGAALEILEAAQPMTCGGCGARVESAVRCRSGHFVCDACHSGSAKDVIERVCLATEDTDPLAISRALMRHPTLKMHGPEHHLLVPAAFLAALANARGEPGEKRRLLAEARRRSEPVAGGFCGFQGACGAAIGAGIAVSLATGATPLSVEPWSLANAATARALDALARVGGPRCCKRNSWLVLLTLVRFAREHLGVTLGGRGEPCTFASMNRECIGERCPFQRGSR
ncbi:DUF5714 domain-containing protein [Anaeromyxobacter oryzisoli]|uniref:DUF5714 domain-containing protein n=1 Tax=Anaeromyxobacter oryzisoli TaxID=2925408 RepID=UPI001F565415|nr:DUF5714 domain-containing protein [Anaeromyxobacter sp. SG63]